MTNPFEVISARLSNLESLVLDIKHGEHKLFPPTNPDATDRFLNIKEAAIFIKLSPATVYNLVMRREIPHMKHRQRLYFSEKELREWIEAGKVKTRKEIETEAIESLG